MRLEIIVPGRPLPQPKPRRCPRPYLEADVAFLRSNFKTMTYREMAIALGRPIRSIANKCHELRLIQEDRAWTDLEVERLRVAYAQPGGPLLEELSVEMGRSPAALGKKARVDGITDPRRKKSPSHCAKISAHATARMNRPEVRAAVRARNLGRVHTAEHKAKIGAASSENWLRWRADPDAMALRSRRISDANKGRPRTENTYSRCNRGKRADLGGLFFRSSWEANYARYLNVLLAAGRVSSWAYECRTFEFVGDHQGVHTYTPDFMVTLPCGSIEWHEVKGWMDAKSRTRLANMARLYPSEVVVLIGKPWFYKAEYSALAPSIAGWEWTRRGART